MSRTALILKHAQLPLLPEGGEVVDSEIGLRLSWGGLGRILIITETYSSDKLLESTVVVVSSDYIFYSSKKT